MFGQTVYITQYLREIDSDALILNTRIIEFFPNTYLLEGTTYDMDYKIYTSYPYIKAYNYLVEKHYTNKKNIYGKDIEKVPLFFEIMYNPITDINLNYKTDIMDNIFTGDINYYNKIVEYI